MKFILTHTVSYDTKDKELQQEYAEWVDDYGMTLENFQEFLIDRFINPNFDKGTTTVMISMEEQL